MCAPTFTAVNLAGAVIWAAPIGLIGFFLGNAVETFWHNVRQWEWQIVCIALILLTCLLAWKDPELCRVSLAFKHIGRFTVLSTHRLRHRLGSMQGLSLEER
jgi:hypothetical protein